MLRVRELSIEKGPALSRLGKRSNDPTVVKRAMIVLHSLRGFSPPRIAWMVLWSEEWVRRVIKDYDRIGRDALYLKKSPGPEPKFTPEIREASVSFALSRPKDHGWPGPTSWSLDLLRESLVSEGVIKSISRERLRQIGEEGMPDATPRRSESRAKPNPGAVKINGEAAVRAAISRMPPPCRELGERVHAIIRSNAPTLVPRTWYGMPAHARGADAVGYFRGGDKVKERYLTLGFNDSATLDEGHLWPAVSALTRVGPVEEAKIAQLARTAVGSAPSY